MSIEPPMIPAHYIPTYPRNIPIIPPIRSRNVGCLSCLAVSEYPLFLLLLEVSYMILPLTPLGPVSAVVVGLLPSESPVSFQALSNSDPSSTRFPASTTNPSSRSCAEALILVLI